MKTWLKILGAVGVLIFGAALIFVSYGWFLERQQKVLTGSASSDFPYRDYTLAELNKMYPQIVNLDVKTIQSPEETYAKLKRAFLDENVGDVLNLFSNKNKNQYSKLFQSAKEKGKLKSYGIKLEDGITRYEPMCFDNMCTYKMNNSKAEINFIKNSRGVWLIETI